jgi:hypothetical protein
VDEVLASVREIREAGLNGHRADREPGVSHAQAQAMLRGPQQECEPEPPDALQRIEALEASWRQPVKERIPKARDLELEAG